MPDSPTLECFRLSFFVDSFSCCFVKASSSFMFRLYPLCFFFEFPAGSSWIDSKFASTFRPLVATCCFEVIVPGFWKTLGFGVFCIVLVAWLWECLR
mmetsp:Transcript_6827/g.16507  ORF Transcript_6827/g.16507 Transcript_6827/m.16507 type:complete len:97 (+) Transcript_6827:1512-1802(+)